MSVCVEYAGESDTGTGPSGNIWNQAGSLLMDLALGNFNRGFKFEDDFTELPTGKWTATQATSGTWALTDEEGGVALASAGAATAAQGINVQKPGELFKAVAGQVIYYEARVKATTIGSAPELFIGLAQVDTTLIASQVLTSEAIGFKTVTAAARTNNLLATCQNGATESNATNVAGVKTLVDGAYVKLGFKVTGTSKVEFYVDGVLVGTIKTNISTTELTPSIVCQAGGTSTVLSVDWIKCVTQRSAN